MVRIACFTVNVSAFALSAAGALAACGPFPRRNSQRSRAT